jgi:glutaredoxin/glutathione-dependent peroxiredoxin
MIKVGDQFPAVKLKHLAEGGMADVATHELFGQGTSVLFGVPGCYTPTCSTKHLPSFTSNMAALKARGVARVACLAVNDPFVMHEWLKSVKAEGIVALPDGNGTLTKALGLEMDGSGYGLGTRVQRFAMIIKDGVITHLAVEAPGQFDVSSGEAILKALAA